MGKLRLKVLDFVDRDPRLWVPYSEVLEKVGAPRLAVKREVRKLEEENLIIWRKKEGEAKILVKDKGHDLLALQKMKNKGLIDDIGDVVGEGKESVIILAKKKGENRIVKLHRYHSAVFTRIKDSLSWTAVKLFREKLGNEKDISRIKAKTEFHVLKTLHPFVSVPKPLACIRHAVLMEFIGEETPAPELRNSFLEKEKVMEQFSRAEKKGFIHGDFSEYNVLSWKNAPVLIDWPQAVPSDYPVAEKLKMRDLKTINTFYKNHK